MRRFVIVGLMLWLSLGGCCEDETPNPCAQIPPTSAEFNAVGFVDGYNLKITCDQNGQPTGVKNERRWTTMPYLYKGFTSIFAPVQKFDSVVWKIGTDSRVFRMDTLYIVFPDTGTVAVTLIGYRKPDLNCNPMDNGVDTLTKNFKIVAAKPKFLARFPGRYEGYEEAEPGRKRIIELVAYLDQWGDVSGIWIKNFPLAISPDADNWGPPGVSDIEGVHDLSFLNLGTTGGLGLFAWIKTGDDGKLEIEYSQVKPPYKNRCDRFIKKFKGKKI